MPSDEDNLSVHGVGGGGTQNSGTLGGEVDNDLEDVVARDGGNGGGSSESIYSTDLNSYSIEVSFPF